MSAFTPFRRQPNNPITTQEFHAEQTSSKAFNQKRGTHFIPISKNGSVPISDKTHFQPIQTHNSPVVASPDLFDPPSIKRTGLKAPKIPYL